jgi:hypothetical protein
MRACIFTSILYLEVMKIIFLTLALLFCGRVSFSQESVWTKQGKISEVIAFEKQLDQMQNFFLRMYRFPRSTIRLLTVIRL